jgi:hypothetical protein
MRTTVLGRPVEINKTNIKSKNIIVNINQSTPPVQIICSNKTDEIKKVSVFEIFAVNKEGVTLELSQTQSGNNISMDFFKKYFYENPHLSSLIRLQCTNLMDVQAEKPFYLVTKNPMGQMAQRPAFIPLDCFSKNQFQNGIMDIPYAFVLDGLSNDLEFDLMPKTTLVFTMFFSHKLNVRKNKSLKELHNVSSKNNKRFDSGVAAFVIENNSDVQREITLLKNSGTFDMLNDPSLKIYNMYNGDAIDTEWFSNSKSYFNSIRIFANSENSENNLKQISKAIEFNSGNKYYPAIEVDGSQFQSSVNDINIIGEELSTENPIRVTVMPKTRVVYLFKKYNKIYANHGSFVNIDIENISDSSKMKYDILSVVEEDKSVLHSIGKNKMSFSDCIDANTLMIQLYNKEQLERPIVLKIKDDIHTIYPICYFDESKFYANIIEVPLPFDGKLNLKDFEILVDLDNKGDGMNVILTKYDKVEKQENDCLGFNKSETGSYNDLYNLHKLEKNNPVQKNKTLVPIWIENTTDEVKYVELVNDRSEYKGFPDGIICNDYEKMLRNTDVWGSGFDKVNLLKIYTVNSSQLTQIIEFTDYTDSENPVRVPIITQNYFSANQLQSTCITLEEFKVFDLERHPLSDEKNEDGTNNIETKIVKKQKISFPVLSKTKVCLIFNGENTQTTNN